MSRSPASSVRTLTFDIFGTVLDLTGGITPDLRVFLQAKGSSLDAHEVWKQWRARQRLEQHQDTILMLGHCGYLEAARRAFLFTMRHVGVQCSDEESHEMMTVFERLQPFDDAKKGLERLAARYELVALSNGNQWLLDKLCDKNIGAPFHAKISVERYGRFKPHPSIYRGAAAVLEREPGDLMMVAAHSFDIHGARACGYRGAFVNRYQLPYEPTAPAPEWTGPDFLALCDWLNV